MSGLIRWLVVGTVAAWLIHLGLVGKPLGPDSWFGLEDAAYCAGEPAVAAEPLTVVSAGHRAGEAVAALGDVSPQDVTAFVSETFELLGVAAGAFKLGVNGDPVPETLTRWEAQAVAAQEPSCEPAAPAERFVLVGTAEPGAWGGHSNGRIPAPALCPLQTAPGHSARCDAARAFDALSGAYRAVSGSHIGVTDSYRSYAAQVDVAARKGLYSQGGLAARPGTSDHGWGLAFDLRLDADALAWMRSNAAEFGFVEDTPREPWHWAFHGTAVAAG